MKLKIAFALTLLVLTSLLSFSNRCGQTCDGRKMIREQQVQDEQTLYEEEPARSSLLRIAVTL